jgi:xanthine dehydrogenase molybdenum-binding subunit
MLPEHREGDPRRIEGGVTAMNEGNENTESKLLVQGARPAPLDRDLTVVGQPIDRLDGLAKVTGQARYAGDLKVPGMLYGIVLRCPHPRAKIVRIDASKAEALAGVRAILTKENTRGWRTWWYEVGEPAFPQVLTREGQEVAAVAADDVPTAERARALIEVEYEVLPPMIDLEEVLGSPPPALVNDEEYPGRERSDRKSFLIRRGDTAKGFAEADVVIDDTYVTPTQYHATIQTRACVASWDGETLTVWDAAQGVWNSKLAFAKSFGLDPERVRVIVENLGGGFGSKAWSHRISYYAARLSMATGKPVRMEQTRAEEFLVHPHRYDCRIRFKMGVRGDGTLTAIEERALVNIGAAAGSSNYNANRIIWQTSNLYECPNVYLEQIGVFTNLQMTGPTRAPFNMPAIFPLEMHIDRLAAAIGMDPLEIRLKNYKTHASTHTKPELMEQEMRVPWSNKQLDVCMRKATEAIGWERRKKLRNASTGPRKRGIGMAAFIAHQGGGKSPNKAYADVDICRSGAIRLHIGVVDIGGGQKTILAMIAAEELGVRAGDIEVIYGDTRDTRYGPACHTSRVTAEMGPPVLQAAAEARDKLFVLAARQLKAQPSELASCDGLIYVKAYPQRSLPFAAACAGIDAANPIRGSGSRESNPDSPLFSSFGAQAAEVEVDTETGGISIVRMTAAQDFGKAINPKLCVSQVVGGIEFGVGYALSEEGIYDPTTGRMLNTNLHQYRVPTSLDMPPIDAILVEGGDPYFAFGARGGAEVTNTPTAAAIGNAIADAIGIWFTELPVTPDKVLEALKAHRPKDEGR